MPYIWLVLNRIIEFKRVSVHWDMNFGWYFVGRDFFNTPVSVVEFRFEIRDRSSWFNYARNCVCKCSQPSGQFNVAQSATDICVHTCSYVHIHKVECDREISTYTHVEPSCITYSITTIIAAPRHTFRPYSLIYEIFIALNFCLHSCVPRFPSTLVQVDFS